MSGAFARRGKSEAAGEKKWDEASGRDKTYSPATKTSIRTMEDTDLLHQQRKIEGGQRRTG